MSAICKIKTQRNNGCGDNINAGIIGYPKPHTVFLAYGKIEAGILQAQNNQPVNICLLHIKEKTQSFQELYFT